MSFRCSLPLYPLPVVCEAWPDFWIPSAPGSTWAQKIDCCEDQRLSVPVPMGAREHTLVAVHWFEHGQRFISYHRLELGFLGLMPRQVTFTMPWDVVGRGGCLPKPHRSCQYGDTPFVEMAAVSISCSALDGQCHAPVDWSFGPLSFTLPSGWGPTHTEHTEATGPGTTVMYIASFPPGFNEPVPTALRKRPPHFPLELDGIPGAAVDRPTERYPVPLDPIINEAPRTLIERVPVGSGVGRLAASGWLLVCAAVVAARGGRMLEGRMLL